MSRRSGIFGSEGRVQTIQLTESLANELELPLDC